MLKRDPDKQYQIYHMDDYVKIHIAYCRSYSDAVSIAISLATTDKKRRTFNVSLGDYELVSDPKTDITVDDLGLEPLGHDDEDGWFGGNWYEAFWRDEKDRLCRARFE